MKCNRCLDRCATVKGKCARCYYAERLGRSTKYEEINKRNFIRNGFGVFTTKSGHEFVVDVDVFESLKHKLWSYSTGYAYTSMSNTNRISLHRIIMPGCTVVDHINKNTFDNRRENLRDGSGGINMLNTNLTIASKSGVRGIHRMRNKWQVRILSRENRVYLGTFNTIEEAKNSLNIYATKNSLYEFYN